MLHPTLQAEADASDKIGQEWEFDGTALVWRRDDAILTFAGERQALPSGAVVLKAHNGPAIAGRYWAKDEVDLFSTIIGGAAVIYER